MIDLPGFLDSTIDGFLDDLSIGCVGIRNRHGKDHPTPQFQIMIGHYNRKEKRVRGIDTRQECDLQIILAAVCASFT